MADDQSVLTEREIKILLTKAEKDPYYALANPDCYHTEFCTRFFALCNEVMFDTPDVALEQAFIARRLAKKTRDPHLIAKAAAMVGAGYRIESLYARAAACIAEAAELASGCICCLSEIRRREGLNLLHERKFTLCYEAWSHSMRCYEQLHDTCGVARVLIHRGSVLYKLERYAEALEDERNGLDLFGAQAPSRYYIAGMVNMAAILIELDERYEDALKCLQNVRDSLKGQKKKHERVRVILRWIEGLIFAKIGRRRDAFKRLFSARSGIERLGLRSEYIAISADISKLYKTGTPRSNDDQVIEIATQCLEKGQPTQTERQILEKLCLIPEVTVIEHLREAVSCRVPAML